MDGWIAAACGVIGILITKMFDIVMYEKRSKKDDANELKEIREEMSSIKTQLKLTEKDELRTQLMVMMKDYPEEKTDILRLAQHYFVNLNGNWVLTDIFSRWSQNQGVSIPSWFPRRDDEK